MSAKYIWLFVDGESQETFRIRTGDPAWQTSDNGSFEQARCSFDIVAEDGTGFKFQLTVTPWSSRVAVISSRALVPGTERELSEITG